MGNEADSSPEFRVHPRHWEDRIQMARQMGLNTVGT
jgi:beta-galactosidase GanA